MRHVPMVIDVVFCLLLGYYLFSTFGKVKSKKRLLLGLAAALVALVCLWLFIDVQVVRTAIIAVCLMCVSFAFDLKLFQKSVLTAVYVSSFCICEVIAVVLQTLLFGVTAEDTRTEPFYSLGLLMSYLLAFLVVLVIRNTKFKLFAGVHGKSLAILFALPVVTLLTVWFEYLVLTAHSLAPFLNIMALVVGFLLIATNFMVFLTADSIYGKYEYQSKLLNAEKLIAEQQTKYRALIDQSDDVRRLRHDEKNFIIGALSTLDRGDAEDLRTQLEARLEKAGSLEVDGSAGGFWNLILDLKSKEAKEKGVSIEHEVYSTLHMGYSRIDLAVIMGNLLDNAVEATAKLTEGEKTVRVFVDNRPEQLIISITNPVKENVNTERLTTTKPDRKNHGYGLISVRQLAEKYDGALSITCKDKVFEVNLALLQPSCAL